MAANDATPRDDFPPHGYLDNPFHSWKLNPTGVLRSRPPAGMGWHTPNHGSYGRNQFAHRAHLHVGVELGGVRLLTPVDFRRRRVAVGADPHTCRRLRYVWTHPAGPRVAATYHLIDEHALGCLVELEPGTRDGDPPPPVRLWLALELAHDPATSRLWEHGLYAVPPGASEPATGAAAMLGICPEGDAWAVGAADDAGRPLVPAATVHEATPWLAGASPPVAREPAGLQTATLALAYDLPPAGDAPLRLRAVLARGPGADDALARWAAALARLPDALAAHAVEDERFWSAAPRLAGDWPAPWRRGLATDLETLRMTVRRPVGVFTGPWDGMQIQAPRAVLAETALDALALAWADTALARAILLGCFASARRPNVPCVREDGSYNMVADDGAICGTGPEWGWPLHAADALWRRTGDRAWLAALYPPAAAYLDWWLSARVDAEGWLVHACSWESGQDVSARFGAQQTGGSDVRHLRPADLQAAAAHGCAVLAGWAAALGLPDGEAARWRGQAERLAARTRGLWHGGWFADYDARRGGWSRMRDPMQLMPLACGLADPGQAAALRPAFADLPPHGAWPPLAWPPVALVALEAALAAGLDARAAELAAAICERAWRRMDAPEPEPDGALPGVTREFWPEGGTRDPAGIEGYGWGALTVHLCARYVAGVREAGPDGVLLVPALPAAWRRPGAEFTIGPLACGAGSLRLGYRVPASGPPDALDVALDLEGSAGGPAGPLVARDAADGAELARAAPDDAGAARLRWRGIWLRAVRVGRA